MRNTHAQATALTVAFFLVAGAACMDSTQEEAELAAEGAQPGQPAGPGAEGVAAASNAFLTEARQATDDLERKVDELVLLNADAMGAAADGWNAAHREIMTIHQELEANLDRAAQTASDGYDDVRDDVSMDIAEGVEVLTEQVEHARLAAVVDPQQFVAASEQQLTEIDESVEALEAEAAGMTRETSAAVVDELDSMRNEADQIAGTLDGMATASADEITETRDEVTQAIASLAGSVQRTRLELRSEIVTGP